MLSRGAFFPLPFECSHHAPRDEIHHAERDDYTIFTLAWYHVFGRPLLSEAKPCSVTNSCF
jgi:hypothetical protein